MKGAGLTHKRQIQGAYIQAHLLHKCVRGHVFYVWVILFPFTSDHYCMSRSIEPNQQTVALALYSVKWLPGQTPDLPQVCVWQTLANWTGFQRVIWEVWKCTHIACIVSISHCFSKLCRCSLSAWASTARQEVWHFDLIKVHPIYLCSKISCQPHSTK